MTGISRRNLVKPGTATVCQMGAVAASRAGALTVTSTEDWLADPIEGDVAAPEPTFALADLWWPEQRNIWTPIGWKNQYFRFNVLYDETIICELCAQFASARPHALRWQGQHKHGVQSVQCSPT
jgi:hypothetical protein